MRSLKSYQIQSTDRVQKGVKLKPKSQLDLRPLGGGSNSPRAPSFRDVTIMITNLRSLTSMNNLEVAPKDLGSSIHGPKEPLIKSPSIEPTYLDDLSAICKDC
ncbi:hypothetical protein Ancab_012588 [Ancistrocladus abbreviatus]